MQSKQWTRGICAATIIWATGLMAGTIVAEQSAGRLAGLPGEGPNKGALETEMNDTTPTRLYVGILGRNLAVYLWLLCGLVSGGLTTIALLSFNGVALGQLAGLALGVGMPVERLAWVTLPHAIPEIGAFLLAGAIGLRGPALVSAWLRGVVSRAPFIAAWRPATFGALVIVAAAAIEVFVTMPIAESGMGL